MNNWIYDSEMPSGLRAIWIGIIGFFLISVLMSIFNWPDPFLSWKGNHWRYSKDLNEGVVACIIVVIVFLYLYRIRNHSIPPLKKVQASALIMCFLCMPILDIYILGVTSDWFLRSPDASSESLERYARLQDLKFYLYISLIGLWLVMSYAIKNRERKSIRTQIPS